MTPAPSKVVPTHTARSRSSSSSPSWPSWLFSRRPSAPSGPGSGSGFAVRSRISPQIFARSRRSAPARAAATTSSSALARYSAGITRVHLATCSASDLDSTQPSASAACSTGCALARSCSSLCSPACLRVMRVQCTSHVRAVRCPSARCPSCASKTSRYRPRAAAAIASIRSSARSRSAITSDGSPATSSSAASPPSSDSTTPSASPALALAGTAAVHMTRSSPPGPRLISSSTLAGTTDISGRPGRASKNLFPRYFRQPN